jgi:hypothetical protein
MTDAPVVADEVNITVANATVRDADFNFLQTQFAGVIPKWQKLCTCRVRR